MLQSPSTIWCKTCVVESCPVISATKCASHHESFLKSRHLLGTNWHHRPTPTRYRRPPVARRPQTGICSQPQRSRCATLPACVVPGKLQVLTLWAMPITGTGCASGAHSRWSSSRSNCSCSWLRSRCIALSAVAVPCEDMITTARTRPITGGRCCCCCCLKLCSRGRTCIATMCTTFPAMRVSSKLPITTAWTCPITRGTWCGPNCRCMDGETLCTAFPAVGVARELPVTTTRTGPIRDKRCGR
mmetsp:Transcript_15792/g.28211  ORF Transcript_15792/g.28211 Transcript_15792/m.28211 type:complete len:244 (-) Transcript_15792:14-745(-)